MAQDYINSLLNNLEKEIDNDSYILSRDDRLSICTSISKLKDKINNIYKKRIGHINEY